MSNGPHGAHHFTPYVFPLSFEIRILLKICGLQAHKFALNLSLAASSHMAVILSSRNFTVHR